MMRPKHLRTIILSLLLLAVNTLLNAQQNRKIPGIYVDMAYHPQNGKLYATAYDQSPSSAVENTRLIAINPRTGQIENQWPLSPAGKIVVVKDAPLLYIASGDSIVRFNLTTNQFDLSFHHQIVPNNDNIYVHDLLVVPEQPELVVAVWRNPIENTYIVGAYDNGVLRPQTIQDWYAYDQITTDGQRIFAVALYSSEITPITLSASGVQTESVRYFFSSNTISYMDGRLYSLAGDIIGFHPDGRLFKEGIIRRRLGKSYILPVTDQDTLWTYCTIGFDVWLMAYDYDNFQTLLERKLTTTKGQYQPDKVIMLDQPANFATLSFTELALTSSFCTAQIATVPDFPETVRHICAFDTVQIAAPGNYPADRYYWSNGAVGKTITYVENINVKNMVLSYQVADDNGCLSAPSAPLQLTTSSSHATQPPLGIGQFGDFICTGGQVELTAFYPDADRGTKYEWSTGETTRSILVTTPGAYGCTVRNANGCVVATAPAPTTVLSYPAPAPPKPQINFLGGDGNEVICSSESIDKLSGPPGYAFYFWSDDILPSSNPQRPIPPGTLTLSLTVKNSQGCISEWSDPVSLQIVPTPAQPAISRSGNLLASSVSSGNQWFLDGVPISGATNQYLTVSQAGVYTVQVGYGTSCPSKLSEPFQF